MGKETNNNLEQSSLKDSKTKPTLRMRWRKFNSSWKITVIPLLIWIITAGYGFLKIDSTGASERTSYGWIFGLFIGPIVFVSLVSSLTFCLQFYWNNSDKKVKSLTKRFFFNLYSGSLFSVIILVPINNLMILAGSELIKTISGRLYIAFIILMPVSGFLFAKSNFELKIFHD